MRTRHLLLSHYWKRIVLSLYTQGIFDVAMLKVDKGLAPTIINDLFPLKETNNYNLRRKLFFKIPRNETVRNGFESISYLGSKIWEMLPSEMQECETLFEWKSKVKSWNPINWPCNLSETYIGGVGYV